jgi:hypothetical protein
MNAKVVLVIRGAPGSGKSTLSSILKDELLACGRTVSLLPWDTFHHFVEPRAHLTRKIILEDTLRLLKAAISCLRSGSDVLIIDGVFLYPEENDAILASFANEAVSLRRYRLKVPEQALVARNLARERAEQLPTARIREVARDPSWETALPGEVVLDGGRLEPARLADIVRGDGERHHVSGSCLANPTTAPDWRMGGRLRQPDLQAFKHFDLLASAEKHCWRANSFFDFQADPTQESRLLSLLQGRPAVFGYLNVKSGIYSYLVDFAQRYGLRCEVTDRWQAPLLHVPPGEDVRKFLRGRSRRLKRSLAKVDTTVRMRYSPAADRLALWQDALWIDRHSWKADEHSDMHGRDREDLQYLPGLLGDHDDYHLAVAYHADGVPGAWSLMLFDGAGQWYAAKWGCTDRGRRSLMGLGCLINHFEVLYSPALGIRVDLWGRRSEIYDQLAVAYVERVDLKVGPI